MAEKPKFTPCVPDLPPNLQYCDSCGFPIEPVEYYSAVMVDRTNSRVDYQTVQVKTRYTNVSRHVGGYCRLCAYKKSAGKRRAGKWLALIGFLGGLAAMFYMAIRASQGGPGGGPGILLMLLGFAAGIAGLSILAGTSFRPGRPLSKIEAYARFTSELKKAYPKAGIAYLTPADAARLTPERR